MQTIFATVIDTGTLRSCCCKQIYTLLCVCAYIAYVVPYKWFQDRYQSYYLPHRHISRHIILINTKNTQTMIHLHTFVRTQVFQLSKDLS